MKNYWIYSISALYFILGVFISFYFDGTGDSGDSIHHYQFARFAPQHPELFFDHWAKPLYVLLASPFAQFGFIGIKLFNVLVTTLTIITTYFIAKKLQLKNSILIPIFLVFATLSFTLTFSGLTEPLFSLFVSLSILCVISEKALLACILVSFLPFIRSEGLLFIGVFGLFFLIKKNLKPIPFLAIGHVVYSIAGYFVHKDLLWVFKKIPYNKLDSTYGNGDLFHFVDQLTYVIGTPIYVLLAIGLVITLWRFSNKKSSWEVSILILLSFWVFFIAHSLFWYLGIFNSMGLKRVFICLMPIIAILSLMGFNSITELISTWKSGFKTTVQAIILAAVFIFPFTPNHGAFKLKEFTLLTDQKLAQLVVENISVEGNRKYLFSHPYLSEVLNIDPFDSKQHELITSKGIDELKTDELIIWDNWFSVVENGITQDYLEQNNTLIKIKEFSEIDGNREVKFAVYKKIN